MIRIRVATSLDREVVRDIHRRAFPEGENQMVSALAVNLLDEQTSPPTISLLAEADGEAVGHVALSPVYLGNDRTWKGYILAPLGVMPDHQKRQLGSKLIEGGIERLSEAGVNILFVYGDPNYYSKFGFNADTASPYSPPFKLQYPFGWQAIALREHVPADSNARLTCVAPLNDPALW